ncbi:MAG: anti-sigma factor [Gemmataceae bacterium]
MLESEANRLASELLAGDLTPEEEQSLRARIEADPEARAALERMQATVAALRAWPESLPKVAIPERRRRKLRPWLVLGPVAAAAAIFLAIQFSFQPPDNVPNMMPPPGGGLQGGGRVGRAPKVDPGWAEHEFAFLIPKEKPGGKDRGGNPKDKFGGGGPPGGGTTGGEGGGPDGGPPGSLGGPQGSKGGANPYRKLVDFDFDLPEKLPGDFKLKEGEVVAKDVLRLSYVSGMRLLRVYLKKSEGPHAPVDPMLKGKILAARRDGLALAVEGAELEFALVEACLKLFVPDPKEAGPGLGNP